jgi:hypothetical protein
MYQNVSSAFPLGFQSTNAPFHFKLETCMNLLEAKSAIFQKNQNFRTLNVTLNLKPNTLNLKTCMNLL